MGCTSSNAEAPSIKSMNITINLYIDQLPLFIVQKIKQKFDYYCDKKFQLTESQFVVMYSFYFKNSENPGSNTNTDQLNQSNNLSTQIIPRLYQYYTDAKSAKLTYKRFMAKYAVLSKCQPKILSNILYFLYSKRDSEKEVQSQMKKQNYQRFILLQRKNFGFQPTKCTEQTISRQNFQKLLIQSGFHWEDSRKKFLLLDKDDIPFEAITRALVDMDLQDLKIGIQYFILSSSWFERWSYYYQGITNQDDDVNYKSTKMIKRRASMQSGKKRKSMLNRSSSSKNDITLHQNTWIIERPTMITFEDIQGQFKGQLKQNIKASQQIKIVSKQIWDLFKKIMPAQMQFKRTANSISTLDYYPKSIYFLKTNQAGKIIDSSFKILQMSVKTKLKQLSLLQGNQDNRASKTKYYFIKNFGEGLWNEEKQQSPLGMCSVNLRFFVVQTTNKQEFIQNYFRNKRSIKNITYGDKIYAYFTFNKKVMPAYIIRLSSQTKSLIHFQNFSFRYQIQVSNSQIQIQQDILLQSIKKQTAKKEQNDVFSFKGIQNIGNTCFINSVIQCLIASPIMQEYLQKTNKFKTQKQPLLNQISELAISLLANKKVSPVKLKKTIDVQLQIFSGNDQHDAQQFLSFLIDKLNAQLKNLDKQHREEQTIVQFLFKGTVQSTLQCLQCQNIKKVEQQLSIVSLPIPEPQYNIYTIYVFPIYDNRIRRVILRQHRNSRVSDYLTAFQERISRNSQEFIFLQNHPGNLKKMRNDLFNQQVRKQTLIDADLSPSVQIHCFQRFRKSQFMAILDQNRKLFKQPLYFDFLDKQSSKWFYGKFIQNKSKIQIMNQDNSVSVIKVKPGMADYMKPLGEKTKELMYKKLITRRFNSTLQKMQHFSIHYMVSFPKQVNYYQLQRLINLCMMNLVSGNSTLKSSNGRKKLPYIIKICQTSKLRCIYCNTAQTKVSSKEQIQKCCKLTSEQMEKPLIWVAKEKNFCIFIDWISMDEYNSEFNAVQTDNLSSLAEKMSSNDKIQIDQCLKLYQKPQNVQMQCDKCKHKHQIRAQIMKNAPNILILHMKQYRVTKDKHLVKMNVNLKWMQFLDISKFCVNQKGSIYELYAYVRHHGSSHSGHYTCAIKRKHPFQNKKVWVNFDDQITMILDNQQKNIDSAYLLFFKRIDMPNSGYVNYNL